MRTFFIIMILIMIFIFLVAIFEAAEYDREHPNEDKLYKDKRKNKQS